MVPPVSSRFSPSRRHILSSALASAGVLALSPRRAWAAGKAGSGEIGVASIDPLYAMVYVAMKQRYFESAGLDMSYINAQSGPRAKQMLAANQLIAAVSGANDPIALSLAGKQAVLVASLDTRIPFANLLVSKKAWNEGVRDIAALAGRSIGITQPQSVTWLMATYFADKFGIKDKVQIRPLGDFSTMLGALKSGSVDGCMATYSMLNQAQKEGFGVPLFDVSDQKNWESMFGGDIPGVGCYVMQETIDKKPEAVQALVTALVRSTDYVAASTPEQIVDLISSDYLPSYDRQLALDAVATFKKTWTRDNMITVTHYDRMIGLMGGGRQISDEDAKSQPYSKMVNMSFVKKART